MDELDARLSEHGRDLLLLQGPAGAELDDEFLGQQFPTLSYPSQPTHGLSTPGPHVLTAHELAPDPSDMFSSSGGLGGSYGSMDSLGGAPGLIVESSNSELSCPEESKIEGSAVPGDAFINGLSADVFFAIQTFMAPEDVARSACANRAFHNSSQVL